MALDNEDSIYDYVLLGWLIFVTGILATTFILVVHKRPTFASLRYKQPYYLYGNIVFGVIAIWASFISNDHFSALDPVRRLNCGLWSYWISHVFGLNMWFTLIMLRFVDKMFIFHRALSSLRQQTKTIVKISVFFMLVTFPVMLASHVSFFQLSYYSEEAHSCTSTLAVKLLLIAWYATCYVAMSFTFLYLERDIHNIYFSEYLSMNHIVGVAQYVFLTNICVNLFGVVQYDYGRFIYTFNISFLFLFTTLRLCGYSLYKALTNDVEYNETIIKNFIAYDLKYLSLRELIPCATLMDGYVEFVRQRYSNNNNNGKIANQSQLFNFENLIACLRKIARVDSSRNPLKKKQSIINKFFVPGCIFNLYMDDERRHEVVKTNDLRLGRKYILEKLDNDFYGVEYLRILNSDDMLNELAPYIKARLGKQGFKTRASGASRTKKNDIEKGYVTGSQTLVATTALGASKKKKESATMDNSPLPSAYETNSHHRGGGDDDDTETLELSVIDIHSKNTRNRDLHKAMHITDDMVADLNTSHRNTTVALHTNEDDDEEADIVSVTDSEEMNPYEESEYDDEDLAPPYNIAIRDTNKNLIISTGPQTSNSNDTQTRDGADDEDDSYDERQRISFLTGQAKRAFAKTVRDKKKTKSNNARSTPTTTATSTSMRLKKLGDHVKGALGTLRTKITASRQPIIEHI